MLLDDLDCLWVILVKLIFVFVKSLVQVFSDVFDLAFVPIHPRVAFAKLDAFDQSFFRENNFVGTRVNRGVMTLEAATVV